MDTVRPFAIITGAGSGVGLELARQAAARGYDLLISSSEPLWLVTEQLRKVGNEVTPVEVDLATHDSVMDLYRYTLGRRVDALIANVSVGLGNVFLDQKFEMVQRVVGANIVGLLALIRCVGRDMRDNGRGKILIAGSSAATMAGGHQAVFNGSKAFLETFSIALRSELEDTGITVTSMMFSRLDSAASSRADFDLAKMGLDAMDAGEASVASPVERRRVMPANTLRRVSIEPGSAP